MELTELQKNSIKNYKMHGINIELKNDVVIISQVKLINGRILSNKDLYNKAKSIFPEYKIRPSVYKIDAEIDMINSDWIKNKMKEYNLKQKDISKQTSLDISTISLFLNNERKMNKSVKALFFYYFMLFDIHQGLNEYYDLTEQN